MADGKCVAVQLLMSENALQLNESGADLALSVEMPTVWGSANSVPPAHQPISLCASDLRTPHAYGIDSFLQTVHLISAG